MVDCELGGIIWLLSEVPPGTSSILPTVHPVLLVYKRNSRVVPVIHSVFCVLYVLVVAEERVHVSSSEDECSVVKTHCNLIPLGT